MSNPEIFQLIEESAILTEEYKGYTIALFPDDEADNPRDEETLGRLCTTHGRKHLPWEHINDEWETTDHCTNWYQVYHQIIRDVKEAGDAVVLALPVYALEHSSFIIQAVELGQPDPFSGYYFGMDLLSRLREIEAWERNYNPAAVVP